MTITPPTNDAVWMRPAMVRNPKIGDYDRFKNDCPLMQHGWNGDRNRGWTFYCACGYATPMRRTFSEAIELLEQHWQRLIGHGGNQS